MEPTLKDMQEVMGRWWMLQGFSEENVQLTLQVYENLFQSSGGQIHPLAEWFPPARASLWVMDHAKQVPAENLTHLLYHPELPIVPDRSARLLRWEMENADDEGTVFRMALPEDPVLAQELQHFREARDAYLEKLRNLLWQERIIHIRSQTGGGYYRLPPRLPGWLKDHYDFPTRTAKDPYLKVLSARPYQMIDRAMRSAEGWSLQDLPRYPQTVTHGLQLEYQQDGLKLADLEGLIHTLDPRTGDVWRLLLALALEEGQSGIYRTLTLDLRELGKAMGFKPHPRGGFRPQQLQEIAQALGHLERLWMTITPEARTLEADTGQHKRVYRSLKDQKTMRVLAVMEKDQPRELEGEVFYLRWHLALGEWARLFEKSYARIFRSLLELPSRPASALWAKQIGTELAYLYREDRQPEPDRPDLRRKQKTLTIQRLLERSCLLHETELLHGQGHHSRAVKRFEQALDLLAYHGVHQGWHYHPEDAARIDDQTGKPGAYRVWLNSRVLVEAPLSLLNDLPAPIKRSRGPRAERPSAKRAVP
ncbi:hypothetical protein [Deinococcus cellulosilyticus]|uniref:Uncharacterized protein n=1 Tax=Deinococcus cellulosilyticus (strain DSM 18568 / NBRC 106333 / KACC 11606 / 5516J-15) TaxID=1223518 RepID=A0A511N937_DEIC1|nr:hypothetical protein [Deinococcus cellulosilyticus]GEM49354.1 hypothetical protein DC3_49890 [Deinococcus cellulosilyticus NBRC 106333 = KACC 11606]